MPSSAPISLHSDRLAVEIAAPGTLYRRSRFDWHGFITQVTLDGEHTFCVPEDYDPKAGSGGYGLCNEFGNEKIFGYDGARPGQPFPKPGIGLLLRPDGGKYSFYREHQVVQPFPVQVDCTPDTARFTVEPLDCRGYAFREVKTIHVSANQLLMTVQFTNLGSQPIHTHEYCHNFIAINAQPTGPDYSLRLAQPVEFQDMRPVIRRMLPAPLGRLLPDFMVSMLMAKLLKQDAITTSGPELSWNRPLRGMYLIHLTGFGPSQAPQWTLTHRPSGLSVSETDDFTPAKIVLWGAPHVMSAEVYIDIDLEPGQSTTWTRTYHFERA